MNRVPVVSSNLAEVGYDPATSTLEIAFKNGGVYQYFSVPSSVHIGLITAPSLGQYFDINIKKAGYALQRITV